MSTETNHILIFRTNILTPADKLAVQHALDGHPQIEKWTVDLDDIDRVLRIVSRTLCCEEIVRLVSGHGYQCTELE
ncbi:MAG: hypothetical protein P4L51_10280 [Puia sp.]|nr:hypothetical protein [Puia sp.]